MLQKKNNYINELLWETENKNITPNEINPTLEALGESQITVNTRISKILSRPKISFPHLKKAKSLKDFFNKNGEKDEAIEQVEILTKYSGYIEKEKENVDKSVRLEGIKIPVNFNYNNITSISSEGREKLSDIKPHTIGQASRISGVSPSDISVLLVYMGR